MTSDLKARLDAMVSEQPFAFTVEEALFAVGEAILSKLDAAEAENEKQKSDFDTAFRESLNTIARLTEERNAAEAQVKTLTAERDEIGEALIRTRDGVPTADDHALYVMALMRRKAARAALNLGGELC